MSAAEDVSRAPKRGIHVVTMGDSTLDNLIWMDKDPATGRFPVDACVIGKLRNFLAAEHAATSAEGGSGDADGAAVAPPRVVNLAADGFTSGNVLHGAVPFLSRSGWKENGEPFPVHPETGVLTPLDELAKLHGADPVSHVVLSVGGNDIREILQHMHALPRIVPQLLRNYTEIVKRIVSLPEPKPQLVVMMQYLPCMVANESHYGVYSAMDLIPAPPGVTALQKICGLMEQVYAPILSLARAHGFPVIDLPRTMDPRDAELYRLQIEPSARGSEVIARLIVAAVTGASDAVLEEEEEEGPQEGGAEGGAEGEGEGDAAATEASRSRLLSSRPADGYRQVYYEVNDFTPPGAGGGGGGGAGRPYKVLRGTAASAAPVDGEARSPDAQAAGAAIDIASMTATGHAQPLPVAVAQLVEMGFEESRVRAALASCGNLPQQALELLLSGEQ